MFKILKSCFIWLVIVLMVLIGEYLFDISAKKFIIISIYFIIMVVVVKFINDNLNESN